MTSAADPRPAPRPNANNQLLFIAAAVLTLLVTVIFRDAVLHGRVFFQRDVHLMWYTQMETFARGVLRGEWPLWNPDIAFGQPLWADANAQVAYPPTWGNLVLRPWTYYTVFVVAHFLWAGLGLYALSRALRVSHPAALVAAAVWLTSGPLLSMVEIWNQLAGTAWVPWGALAAFRAKESGAVQWAAAWAACLAFQVLAGAPETALLTAVGTVAYGTISAGGPRRAGRFLGHAALAGLGAIGLSAAQWLPSLDVAARSVRPHLSAAERTFWSVHPATLLQTVFPVPLHALPLRPEIRAALFEAREPLFPSLYLGLTATALVGAALLRSDRRLPLLLVAGLGAATVVALGRHTPLDTLTAVVPLVRSLRYPVKAMVGASFCWALLVGLGVDAWSERPRARGAWLGAVLAPVAILAVTAAAGAVALQVAPDRWAPLLLVNQGGALTFRRLLGDTVPDLATAATFGLIAVLATLVSRWRHPRALALGVGACAVLDLGLVHQALSPTAPRELFIYRPPALATATPPDHQRLYVYDYNLPGKSEQYLHRATPFAIKRAPDGWPAPAATALAMRLALVPPSPGVWGVAGSFDRDTPGIAPLPLGQLDDLLVASEGTPAHLALMRTGAVARVATLHSEGFPGLAPIATADALMDEALHVFAVPDARPRTYAVEGVRAALGPDALRLMCDPAFEPAREVILPLGSSSAAGPGFEGTARLHHLGTDRAEIEADLGRDGFVVLVDAFDPGWTATVDGRPAPVLRANVAFRAVPVPRGHHRIVMRYRPRSVFIGLFVSATTLLGALALVLWSRIATRRREAA